MVCCYAQVSSHHHARRHKRIPHNQYPVGEIQQLITLTVDNNIAVSWYIESTTAPTPATAVAAIAVNHIPRVGSGDEK